MKTLLLATLPLWAGIATAQTVPYVDSTEPGIRFPLPHQRRDVNDRRQDWGANALTVSWDGRLMMFMSSEWNLWTANPYFAPTTFDQKCHRNGIVFCTFNPDAVALDTNGRPDFANCFGPTLPRFATTKESVLPGAHPGNTYPESANPYPCINGSMGELGLFTGWDSISTNLHPAPDAELPAGAENHNPFRSDSKGQPSATGTHMTYHAYLTLQDQPRFWNGSAWPAWGSLLYEVGTAPNNLYPNGKTAAPNASGSAWGWPVKRNGVAKLEIIVATTDPAPVTAVNVLHKWSPFLVDGPQSPAWSTAGSSLTRGKSVPYAPHDNKMWADNFEPILSNDGHFMIGKGLRSLVTGDGPSFHAQIVFYYNDAAFADTGWKGPWPLHHLYAHRNDVVGGLTLAERYPLAREPFKAYDGKLYADTDNDLTVTPTELEQWAFEGGYCWLDPDVRFVLYSVFSGGVGNGHPQMLDNPVSPHWISRFDDGGGTSNRAQASIIGSVTGWQQWRIDHAAVNPSRHCFTAWDFESRTVHIRQASFGFAPGFWHMLRGASGLPLRDDGTTKLQLVNSQRGLYYEIDLSPHMERDYGFYLPMTEMLVLEKQTWAPTPLHELRQVDVTRTPDLSGNGNVGHQDMTNPGQLPCEYFGLPQRINGVDGNRNVPGLYQPVAAASAAAAAPLIAPNWPATQVVGSVQNGWWARLADGRVGVGTAAASVPGYTLPTGPEYPPSGPGFPGRGEQYDMDSDTAWGRVGQGMFFKNGARLHVVNTPAKPELNPGTFGNPAKSFSATLWVRPLQSRTGTTRLIEHNFTIDLLSTGQILGQVTGAGAGTHGLTSASPHVAPANDWTHIALSWEDLPATNSSRMRLFVNGAEVAGSPKALPFDLMTPSNGDIQIGCLGSVATTPTMAVLLLDEVALKNHAIETEDALRLALQPMPAGPTFVPTNLPPAPVGLSNAHAKVPATNVYNPLLASIGADLFHDVQLSGRQDMSCATCHVPSAAFTDGQKTATGLSGPLPRNTPSIFNVRWETSQFWDARAPDLEAQSLEPVFHPDEMGLAGQDQLEAYLNKDAGYVADFASAGVGPIKADDARRALATFMRSVSAGNSPADGTLSGNAAARRGRGLFFGKARCSGCHTGPTFTDGRLWNTGSMDITSTDAGAANDTAGPLTRGRTRFRGAFKTPTLRQLPSTGPYFHDGYAPTLADVVEFYDAGGVRTDNNGAGLLDQDHHRAAEEINRPLQLTPQEKSDLVAFLDALAGTTIDNGAVGNNRAPTVSLVQSGNVLTLQVTDTNGAGDIDTKMQWTLHVSHTVGSPLFGPKNWSHATAVVAITNGVQCTVTLPAGSYPAQSLAVKAADMHGKWSAVVTN